MTSKSDRKTFLMTLILTILIFITIHAAKTTKKVQKNYSHLIKVKTLEKTITKYGYDNIVYPNATLYTKFYGRLQTFNGYIMIRKPIYKFYAEGTFLQMKDQKFQQRFKVPKVEVCEIIKFSSETFFLRELFDLAKRMAPELIHECPYKGVRIWAIFKIIIKIIFQVLEGYNITIPYTNLFKLFPSGLLKRLKLI